MNYYKEIKEKLIQSEIYDRAKDYSKERHKVEVYFEIGRLLNEAGKEYGKNIIKQYSIKLVNEIGKKYNERNLRYMRRFYEIFVNQIWNTSCSKLCWSHYREVLSLKDINAIRYYLNEAESKNLTIKELQNIIRNCEYERLPNQKKDKLENKEEIKVNDLIPNPIIIKNNTNINTLTEYALMN